MAGLMKRLFRGTESAAEEKAEARAVRSGKITPKQYVAGEKSEGETEPGMMARAKALKSGKMSPAAYAKHEKSEKMCGGGKVKRMMFGGIANAPQTAAQQNAMAQKASALKAAATPKLGSQIQGKVGAAAQQANTRANAVKAAVQQAAASGKPARPMKKGGGVEAKGKTAGKTVKMAKGGGIESKGKTKGRMC